MQISRPSLNFESSVVYFAFSVRVGVAVVQFHSLHVFYAVLDFTDMLFLFGITPPPPRASRDKKF